jgi:hypothetical protein
MATHRQLKLTPGLPEKKNTDDIDRGVAREYYGSSPFDGHVDSLNTAVL